MNNEVQTLFLPVFSVRLTDFTFYPSRQFAFVPVVFFERNNRWNAWISILIANKSRTDNVRWDRSPYLGNKNQYTRYISLNTLLFGWFPGSW